MESNKMLKLIRKAISLSQKALLATLDEEIAKLAEADALEAKAPVAALPAIAVAPKKRGRPPKAKADKAAAPKAVGAPKKRGRPPKAKVELKVEAKPIVKAEDKPVVKAEVKPVAKVATKVAPKKRGRPPKKK